MYGVCMIDIFLIVLCMYVMYVCIFILLYVNILLYFLLCILNYKSKFFFWKFNVGDN